MGGSSSNKQHNSTVWYLIFVCNPTPSWPHSLNPIYVVFQWYDCYLCYKYAIKNKNCHELLSDLSFIILRSMTMINGVSRKIIAKISGADDTTWIWIGIGIAWWCIVTTCNCTKYKWTNICISTNIQIYEFTWIWWSWIWFKCISSDNIENILHVETGQYVLISNKLQYDNHDWWPLWDVYLMPCQVCFLV